jgi:hypothetical protein
MLRINTCLMHHRMLAFTETLFLAAVIVKPTCCHHPVLYSNVKRILATSLSWSLLYAGKLPLCLHFLSIASGLSSQKRISSTAVRFLTHSMFLSDIHVQSLNIRTVSTAESTSLLVLEVRFDDAGMDHIDDDHDR